MSDLAVRARSASPVTSERASRLRGALRDGAPVALLGALGAACGIGLLGTSGWLITRASERPPVFVLCVAIGAVQAFAIGRGVLRYFERLGIHRLALDRLAESRTRLFDALEPLVPGARRGLGSGDVLSGFVTDTEIVTESFAKRFGAGIDVGASVVLACLIAAIADPSAGMALLAGALFVVVLALAASGLSARIDASDLDARADLAESVMTTVRSARELTVFGREDLIAARLDDASRRSTDSALRRSIVAGAARATTLVALGVTVVAVTAAAVAAHDAHRLSGVGVAAVVFVALALVDLAARLPEVLTDSSAAKAARTRLAALSTTRRETPDQGTALAHDLPDEPDAALEGVTVAVEDAVLLAEVTFAVGAGRRLALVGRTGSGKTTALYALLDFVRCHKGRALIGGADVASLSRSEIAHAASWMPEETHLFNATLGENVRLGRASASDDECLGALRRAGLATWLAGLPDGLETQLGSEGRAVSAGERQRIGLARTMLPGSPVLLLDEPSSHLDAATVRDALEGVLARSRDRAVLVVSHEPAIGQLVDDVVELSEGRVIAKGANAVGFG